MTKQPKKPTPAKADANKRREIKEISTKLSNLSPKATAEVVNGLVVKSVGKQVGGFTEFLREQGIVGLAIGLVLGIQVKAVVDQFMASFITPLLSLLLPGSEGGFAKRSLTISFGEKHQTFVWGQFVISLLTLIIVAAIIYCAFKMLRLDRLAKKKDK